MVDCFVCWGEVPGRTLVPGVFGDGDDGLIMKKAKYYYG